MERQVGNMNGRESRPAAPPCSALERTQQLAAHQQEYLWRTLGSLQYLSSLALRSVERRQPSSDAFQRGRNAASDCGLSWTATPEVAGLWSVSVDYQRSQFATLVAYRRRLQRSARTRQTTSQAGEPQ
jgi:hypothetical protein